MTSYESANRLLSIGIEVATNGFYVQINYEDVEEETEKTEGFVFTKSSDVVKWLKISLDSFNLKKESS